MLYTKSNSFEQKLAYHSAPVLLGIKPSNLMSLNANDEIDFDMFNIMLLKKGIKIKTVCHCKNRKLLFIYNERMLSILLSENSRKEFMAKYGYDCGSSIESILNRLAERISRNSDFPHEIGIFLGYPIEDVIGFIENKGENFKLCGYWKVYGDEEKAKRTFENYNKCRNFLCNKLNQGYDICEALKIS